MVSKVRCLRICGFRETSLFKTHKKVQGLSKKESDHHHQMTIRIVGVIMIEKEKADHDLEIENLRCQLNEKALAR